MTEPMGVGRAYLRAARYFRDDWGKILFSTVLIGLNTLARLGQPFPIALLVDSVIDNKQGGDWVHRLFGHYAPASKLQQIIMLALATLALRGLQELLGLWQGMYNLRIGFNGLLRVRCDLYRKLQQLSISYHRARPQGDAIYRLGIDTTGVQAAFNVVQSIFVNLVMLVCMSIIMLGMNWKLALCAMAVMPVLFWTMRAYGSVLMSSSTKVAQVESDLTTAVQRSVNSIGLVQAFGREDDEYANFQGNVERTNRAWMRMHMHSMVYWLVIGLVFGCGTAVILGYGGWLAYQYSLGVRNGMTIGFLWVFLAYLSQLYDPLQKLSGSGVDLHRGMAGMLRVYEVLDTQATVRDDPHAESLPRRPRVLTLEHASFEYSPQAQVLKDVSVTIRPGEMVAFVGPSGVGKSSLLNLLPRFYDPTAGRVALDGHDFRKIKLRDLRKHVALVLQENAILPTTVAENIAYGVPGASLAAIRQAAVLAGADGFIQALPQQYDTVLTEGGLNLSGGQRQRISIARALATEAPILVLDEPTSALDPHSEQMITETLHGLKGHRTIVLVSHRLSTVFDCDRIYVMDAGKIVEQGTHDQLLALGGFYYRMAMHQLKLGDSGDGPSEPGSVTPVPPSPKTGVTDPGSEQASLAHEPITSEAT
jgi:ABC-type multidrug transport system fused ATPase/permease subunit